VQRPKLGDLPVVPNCICSLLFSLSPILDRGNAATPASAALQTIGVVLNSDTDLSLNHCDSERPLRVEPGRSREPAEQSLSFRTGKPRADAHLPAAALPLQHTKRIVREAVDIETCIQGIEAAPHDDDVRGRHDDRVLAAAALHGERP